MNGYHNGFAVSERALNGAGFHCNSPNSYGVDFLFISISNGV